MYPYSQTIFVNATFLGTRKYGANFTPQQKLGTYAKSDRLTLKVWD